MINAIQKPIDPPPKAVEMVNVIKAPTMYREPCHILGIRSTPKIRLKPEATMKRITVRLKPTKIWDMIRGGMIV
jgi:hypothetical protein